MYLFAPGHGIAPATQEIAPNHSAFGVSDFSGTVTRDGTKLRLVRPIAVSGAYEYAAPGARVRFNVTLAAFGRVLLHFNFTSLITRHDVFNDVGSIYVDGRLRGDFQGPGGWTAGNPHPSGAVDYSLSLTAGTHLVEILFPYSASVDFSGVALPSGATLAAAPPRPSQLCLFLGDSIIQGFNASRMRSHWTFLLAQAKGWQHINWGFGGRDDTAADFTTGGAVGAQRCITNYGINDCFDGRSASAIQSQASSAIANYRAACASGSTLYWINLFDCTNPSLVTAPATARTAIAAAFAASGGAHDVPIPGGTAGGLPSSATFNDLTHPPDAQSAGIASVIGGLVA